MKIGRNEKCPCGSGKKYKKCCLIHGQSKSKLSEDFEIVLFLKDYKQIELLLWLQIMLCHPSNTRYAVRIEYLIALILSIEPEKFKNKEVNREVVQSLILKSEETLSGYFMMMEDFEGFDQHKLIPFVFKGESYSFFYADYERPFEYLKQFVRIFIEEVDGSEELEELFVCSLNFQNKLLHTIINTEESKIIADGIYIPSDTYYASLVSLFSVDSQTDFITMGYYSDKNEDELKQLCVQKKLHKHLFVKDEDGSLFFLYPQSHLFTLFEKGTFFLKQQKNYRESSISNFKKHVFNECSKFFTRPRYIPEILEAGTNKNLLNGQIDFACIVDTNKLLLFTTMDYSFEEDISDKMENTINTLLQIKDTILSNNIVGINEFADDEIHGFLTEYFEIICLPIFESSLHSQFLALKETSLKESIIPFTFNDLICVFDKIERPIDFIKFLREDSSLKKRTKIPLMGDFMDRFSYYISNGKSYMSSGRNIDYITFAPYEWAEMSMNELYEKYKDPVFVEIEKKFPYYFNTIESSSENIYRMVNSADLNGAYLVKFPSRSIWIYPPLNGFRLDGDNVKIAFDLLLPLFADNINKFCTEIEYILKIRQDYKIYSVFILPKEYIEKTKEFKYLLPMLPELSNERPLVFKTYKYDDGNIRTCIVYGKEEMLTLFGGSDNEGERYSMKEFFLSIHSFFHGSQEQSLNYATELIEKKMKLDTKGYSLEALGSENPRLFDYKLPIDFNDTDIAVANRKISEYLIKNKEKYKPGVYEGEEAQKLNEELYNFLQKELEIELRQYPEHILHFCYAQLEINEGNRFKEGIRKGMQAKGKLKFDIKKTLLEDQQNEANLSLAIRHILHTILACDPSGKKFINSEGWTYLLALSKIILDTTMIYDHINYSIKKYYVEITEDYLVVDREGDEIIDSLSFFSDKVDFKLESIKLKHEKAKEIGNVTQPKEIVPMSKELKAVDDAILKDFGFHYDNLMFLLLALRRSNLQHEAHFPVTIVSLEEIRAFIKSVDKLQIDDRECDKIINCLSLSYDSFSERMSLIPSHMMRNKERINVSPFIKLNNGKILYGNEVVNISMKFWSQFISGESPFSLKDKPNLDKVVKEIHREIDLDFEKDVELKAINILGKENVEARLLNFRRISKDFKKQESCGEIDLLCINRKTKRIFVLDAKNVNTKINLYSIKQNFNDFFESKKSYYSKLEKKKRFVIDNLSKFLEYFEVSEMNGWEVISAFITTENLYAKYFKPIKVEFLLLEELEVFLNLE